MFAHKTDTDPLMDLYYSSSLDELNDKFKNLCENYFIERFALATVSKTEKININKSKKFSCFGNYPLEWTNYYENEKYYLKDPVFLTAQSVSTPYYWNADKFNDITDDQKKILSEGCDFGIKRGTTIPLLPNGKFNGLLNLADMSIHHPEVIYMLSNASQIYINKKEQIELRDKFKLLTDKEMQVMHLKSEGYLAKQIAAELSISDATVNFHLKNIREKLGFATTEQAAFNFIYAKNSL